MATMLHKVEVTTMRLSKTAQTVDNSRHGQQLWPGQLCMCDGLMLQGGDTPSSRLGAPGRCST